MQRSRVSSGYDGRLVYRSVLLASNPWMVWARVSVDTRGTLTTVHADLEIDLVPVLLTVALPWAVHPSVALGLAADALILVAGAVFAWLGVRHIRRRLRGAG